MAWRRSSAMSTFLLQLAEQFKHLPDALFTVDTALRSAPPTPDRTAPRRLD